MLQPKAAPAPPAALGAAPQGAIAITDSFLKTGIAELGHGPTVNDLLDVRLESTANLPYPKNASEPQLRAWHKTLAETALETRAQFAALRPMGSQQDLSLSGLSSGLRAQAQGSLVDAASAQKKGQILKGIALAGATSMGLGAIGLVGSAGHAGAGVLLGFLGGAAVGAFAGIFCGDYLQTAQRARDASTSAEKAANLVDGWASQLSGHSIATPSGLLCGEAAPCTIEAGSPLKKGVGIYSETLQTQALHYTEGTSVSDFLSLRVEDAAQRPYPANYSAQESRAWHQSLCATALQAREAFASLRPFDSKQELTITGLSEALKVQATSYTAAAQESASMKSNMAKFALASGVVGLGGVIGLATGLVPAGPVGTLSVMVGGLGVTLTGLGYWSHGDAEKSCRASAQAATTSARLFDAWNGQKS